MQVSTTATCSVTSANQQTHTLRKSNDVSGSSFQSVALELQVKVIVPVHRLPKSSGRTKFAGSSSILCELGNVRSDTLRIQLAIMGKMKKAGINEKAVDARAAKEMAKTSKHEKESKQKEDADWAAAGEGT